MVRLRQPPQGLLRRVRPRAAGAIRPLALGAFPLIYDPTLYNLTAYFQGLCAEDRGAFIVNGLLPPVFYKYTEWSYEKEWRLVLVCEKLPRSCPPRTKAKQGLLGSEG